MQVVIRHADRPSTRLLIVVGRRFDQPRLPDHRRDLGQQIEPGAIEHLVTDESLAGARARSTS